MGDGARLSDPSDEVDVSIVDWCWGESHWLDAGKPLPPLVATTKYKYIVP